ncbi:MAG: very short patch repair endonuclease [Nitrospirae bacterium]|nr:very short patch repair endonuclease [Nitrospirota bacterium]
MSRVKSKDTSIEIKLGKALWSAGLRYRKNYKKLFGTPDFVLVKYKIAIFCDSSFWHGYRNMTTKIHSFKSNKEFWTKKIETNIRRDKEVDIELQRLGWTVFRFWDFQIDNHIEIEKCVTKVLRTTMA